ATDIRKRSLSPPDEEDSERGGWPVCGWDRPQFPLESLARTESRETRPPGPVAGAGEQQKPVVRQPRDAGGRTARTRSSASHDACGLARTRENGARTS